MNETKFTPGPYLRTGTTIYALQHAGWRKGEEQFCNRTYANVQRGPGCSLEEAEAVAALFQAAPDLLEALQEMVKHFTKTPSTLADSVVRGKAHAAIKKALGE